VARRERTTTADAGSPSVLRRLNLAHVLRTIRQEGPMSRGALVSASGLSKPTVNEVVEALLAENLIVESMDDGQTLPRRPGPRARLLRFNSRRAYVVGVDVGAAKLRALLADLDGDILASVRRATPRRDGGAVLDAVRDVLREAIDSAGIEPDDVAAVVVGAPGVVDPNTGTVRYVPQFPEWHGQPLQDLLSESLDARVLVQSEAHLAVAGEHWRGAAQGSDNAVYLQMGVGVGMGILINGTVYRGTTGAAGEVGYLPLNGTGPAETPEGFGPFETAVGATAFTRLAAEAISQGRGREIAALADGDEPGPATVLHAAAAGDRTAQAIVDQILGTLAQGLVGIAAVLNPEIIVLGGGLAEPLAPYLPRLQQVLAGAVPTPPRLVLTTLADNAVAMGALRLGVERVEAELFESLSSA
jgi:predicted NBD/HSP70 family sugar kinase